MSEATTELEIRCERQQNPIADEVMALVATVRPILHGLLYTLKEDIVLSVVEDYDEVTLKLLARLYRPGDGDCGICYEYAIHEAVRREDGAVLERICDALRKCKVPGNSIESILFGVEKRGASQLIATAQSVLTDESRLLTGKPSQPPKLKGYLNQIAAAFRRKTTRKSLPTSINGLWKADLFLGTLDGDRWVGTTVKINRSQLEAANGLRLGIVPSNQGTSDRIRKDESKNLIVCPLPYDGAFMEIFYQAWGIVQQVILADAKLPKEVRLPISSHRLVANELVSRRDFPVTDIIDALIAMSQPELLVTDEQAKPIHTQQADELLLDGLISPIAKPL